MNGANIKKIVWRNVVLLLTEA